MGLKSTAAVVSRTMRMTDSSKLVSLVTERYGLVKVMAKGARRPKSKYGAALEPVTLIDCTYYDKDSRDIQSISDADIIEPYLPLKTDIGLFSIAACMTEIAEAETAQDDPSAGTFALLVETLGDLAAGRRSDADKHLWRFILRLLSVAGYTPRLDKCIVCGKNPKGKPVFFSFSDGGIICPCTGPRDRFGLHISPGALMIMKELTIVSPPDIHRLKMTRAQCSEVEQAVLRFLSFHTGRSRPPRSLAFLRKLQTSDEPGGSAHETRL